MAESPRHLLLALGLGLAPLAACRCPDPARLVGARRDTPQATVEAFQSYLSADLYEQEYGCLSTGFRRRESLSLFTYSVFRDRQPWYGLISNASVTRERSLGPAAHEVELTILGKTLRVRLVREEFFRVHLRDGYADGRADMEKMVRIEARPNGDEEWVLRLPREASETSVTDLRSATLERLWLIDGVELVESP